MRDAATAIGDVTPWWRPGQAAALRVVHSGLQGLTQRQAASRLRRQGPNALQTPTGPSLLRALASRLANPLILVLLAASLISAFTGDAISFVVIAAMVLMSIVLDMVQEHRAGRAVEALRHSVAQRARAWRDARLVEVSALNLVTGDVVELSAGDLIAADGRVLAANDFFVNQAALTGEAYPVEKRPLESGCSANDLLSCAHAVFESFLFAVALAVGLTPELLPMIVSVTLARGAVRMARGHVIVKRLAAVQDLGAMDVLCTDKTGTLTEAQLRVERVFDAEGQDAPHVVELAWLNSHFETGLKSPLDDAILVQPGVDASTWRKLDEVPFDFERRRVSVLLEREGQRLLIVKGAPEDILRLSTFVDTPGGTHPLDDATRGRIARSLVEQGEKGLRLLAVATRRIDATCGDVSAADEHDFAFAGLVAFADPPKLSTSAALRSLAEHGIAVKIVTGDNESVTRHLCAVLQIPIVGVLTGAQIAAMDDTGLRAAAERTNLFCRVTPEQKNRIVLALQARGHVVGYLGDGINDAPPLHSADVGISVDAAADLVLLQHDLGVLRNGVREGRRTLINVNKYVLMATSSNFGNMVSMAAAALFLPFLPMRPVQILLNNFLYDVSELAIPTDRVDDADLLAPRRWDTPFVRNFMLCFGPLSSAFDLTAFALLYWVLHTSAEVSQTAWFVESMATQVFVIFVIRTTRSCWRDHPSPWLVAASVAAVGIALALPFLPWGRVFGLVPLPAEVLGLLTALTLGYLAVAEVVKHAFYRWIAGPAEGRVAISQRIST